MDKVLFIMKNLLKWTLLSIIRILIFFKNIGSNIKDNL